MIILAPNCNCQSCQHAEADKSTLTHREIVSHGSIHAHYLQLEHELPLDVILKKRQSLCVRRHSRTVKSNATRGDMLSAA
jgi:hypothetical protein